MIAASTDTDAVGIPAPTDSYDHENCTQANLTSIRALIAAFDASMDSLHESIQGEIKRIDEITSRAKRCELQWDEMRNEHKHEHECSRDGNTKGLELDSSKLESTFEDSIVQICLPSTYEEIFNHKTNQSLDHEHGYESAIAKARDQANAAIKSILREDAMTFESNAKPSDAWLDRGVGFDQKSACDASRKMLSVPPLLIGAHNSIHDVSVRGNVHGNANVSTSTSASASAKVVREEIEYYKNGMNQLQSRKSTATLAASDVSRIGAGADDEVSLMNQSYTSGQTGFGTLYSTYSEGTASHRRRQRKLASAMRRKKQMEGMSGGGIGEGVSGVGTGGGIEINSGNLGFGGGVGKSLQSSRQHLMSGSLPYVCEMIHDTHYLGSVHSKNVFPEVENVCDLFIYGTGEMAYEIKNLPSTSSGDSSGNSIIASNPSNRSKQTHEGVVATKTGRKSSSELFRLAENDASIEE